MNWLNKMKNNISYFWIILVLLSACTKQIDRSDNDRIIEINDFIWKGLNAYYLWKDMQPELADQRFQNQAELNEFLQKTTSPENLFQSLLYRPGQIDRWSWIVSNYDDLLKLFQGIRLTNGMHFGLVFQPGSQTNLFAYVKYVVPNSPSAQAGIKRGDMFKIINGQNLTVDNYHTLLSNKIWHIELAQWDGQTLTNTGQIKSIEKIELAENPVYLDTIYQISQHKVGYLIYNGFTDSYNDDLKAAMLGFKTNHIDRLIIDLRYNPGGSVETLQYLASMITGQFQGKILLKYRWHSQLQTWMKQYYPDRLTRKFVNHQTNGTSLPMLNMDQVVFITTKNSASASESLINGLKPYIDVTQIGTATHGKYTASITLFDSPDFSSYHKNPTHKWAMQPIVLKISNAVGNTDFYNGLQPDIMQAENYFDLGHLGNTSEPLLQTALSFISTQTRPISSVNKMQDLKAYPFQSYPLEFDMHLNGQDLLNFTPENN